MAESLSEVRGTCGDRGRGCVRVRVQFMEADARELSAWLLEFRGTDQADRVRDALWIRLIICEAMRRVPIADRDAFAMRGDRILAAVQQ